MCPKARFHRKKPSEASFLGDKAMRAVGSSFLVNSRGILHIFMQKAKKKLSLEDSRETAKNQYL
jgi:hypothetical protein